MIVTTKKTGKAFPSIVVIVIIFLILKFIIFPTRTIKHDYKKEYDEANNYVTQIMSDLTDVITNDSTIDSTGMKSLHYKIIESSEDRKLLFKHFYKAYTFFFINIFRDEDNYIISIHNKKPNNYIMSTETRIAYDSVYNFGYLRVETDKNTFDSLMRIFKRSDFGNKFDIEYFMKYRGDKLNRMRENIERNYSFLFNEEY